MYYSIIWALCNVTYLGFALLRAHLRVASDILRNEHNIVQNEIADNKIIEFKKGK